MYTALIADDEHEIVEGLKTLIDWNGIGFTVAAEADNGSDAYELMKTGRFDILLTDIRLPAMSGLDVALRLHQEGTPCKTVVFSAFADFEYARAAMGIGIRKYLLKPIDEDELAGVLFEIKAELDARGEYEAGGSGQKQAREIISHGLSKAEAEDARHSACGILNDNMIVGKIKRYIEDNCTKDINIKNISKEFCYNASYIGRIFSTREKINIKEYITQCRINTACGLLLEGRFNTVDIAAETGFSDLNRFYTSFRRIKGCTPKEYKLRAKKELELDN